MIDALGTRNDSHNATSMGEGISGLQIFTHVQALSLTRPPGCTYRRWLKAIKAARPFTPRSLLVGYLPQAVVSLRTQDEQLVRLDFHQQNCSFVGCSRSWSFSVLK
jgi:hypothetical protein